MKEKKTGSGKYWLIALLVLLVAIAGYFLFARDKASAPAPVPVPDPIVVPVDESVPPVPPEPPIQTLTKEPEEAPAVNPIEPLPSETPLPELSASDEPFRLALGEIGGRAMVTQILSEELIYHIVVTIDNLPRKHLPASIVPLKRAAGVFVAVGKDESLAIGAENSKRYSPYTAVAKSINSAQLVDLYRRYYPLFQSAYRELGYPQAHFNDRLVEAIDDLLAAPAPSIPVRLTQPRVLYEYADPKTEDRSAGQKIMIRIGQENAAAIKKKLADIRALIAR